MREYIREKVKFEYLEAGGWSDEKGKRLYFKVWEVGGSNEGVRGEKAQSGALEGIFLGKERIPRAGNIHGGWEEFLTHPALPPSTLPSHLPPYPDSRYIPFPSPCMYITISRKD